jgi:DNA-binding CsgD family transcriptional regulator
MASTKAAIIAKARSALKQAIAWASIEKSLLNLHRSSDIVSFWKAIQEVIRTAMPDCSLGVSMQRDPALRVTQHWTCQIPFVAFSSGPFHAYVRAHSGIKFVRTGDVFSNRNKLRQSNFYRQHMAPQKCIYACGLFFWNSPTVACVIMIMRTEKQGDFSEEGLNVLRHLHPQFQTALRRLRAVEREHSARLALEEFLSRLPLPTMLLQWNLTCVYQNQAAREFCALWERGPDLARVLKTAADIPIQILDGCRALKQRWEKSSRSEQEMVHNTRWPHLRAAITLKQLNSTGVARPHFLIECEELRARSESAQDQSRKRLPHLVRLTAREQQVVLRVCEGRSNMEIAEDVHLSLPMVKKHLHAIFHKLEVPSRSRLMALLG